jgi:hypothetical protein
MDPKSEAGETMFSVCWLFKFSTYDIDELRRACFWVRWGVCTKLQTGRTSHDNQQNELYCNSEYLVIVASTIVITFLITHFHSNVTCKAAIYLGYVIANSLVAGEQASIIFTILTDQFLASNSYIQTRPEFIAEDLEHLSSCLHKRPTINMPSRGIDNVHLHGLVDMGR